MFIVIQFILVSTVVAMPPACFISCTSEIARTCANGLTDLTCLCSKEDELVTCLVDICPFGVFLSARDHYIGTCLEHGRPTVTNPFPPAPAWPPVDGDDQPAQEEPPQEQPVEGQPPQEQPMEEPPDEEQPIEQPVEQLPEEQPVEQPQEEQPVEQPIQEPAPQEQPQQQRHDTTFRTRLSRTTHRATPTMARPPKTRVTAQPKKKYPQFDLSDDDDDNLVEDFQTSDSEDDLYNPNTACEWEETDALDEHGNFIVIRRPINVPKKYRNPANVGHTRRVLIKRPVNYYSHGENGQLDPPHRMQRVKKIQTSKASKTPKKPSTRPGNSYSAASYSNKNKAKKTPQAAIPKVNDTNKKKRVKVNRKSL